MLPPVFATGRFPLLAQPSPGIKILQGVNSNLLAEHYWRGRVRSPENSMRRKNA